MFVRLNRTHRKGQMKFCLTKLKIKSFDYKTHVVYTILLIRISMGGSKHVQQVRPYMASKNLGRKKYFT